MPQGIWRDVICRIHQTVTRNQSGILYTAMMDNSGHNADIENDEPKTVGELLTRSILGAKALGHGTQNAVYQFAASDANLSDYAIRVRKPYFSEGGLKSLLASGTSLTPPHIVFCGPKASQPLLQIEATDPITKRLEVALQIAPRHEGKTLRSYLGLDSAELPFTEKMANCAAFMNRMLEDSKPLEDLLEQAAFIGLHHQDGMYVDFHSKNIMVDTRNGQMDLSLIDIIYPFSDAQPSGDLNQKRAADFVANLTYRLRADYCWASSYLFMEQPDLSLHITAYELKAQADQMEARLPDDMRRTMVEFNKKLLELKASLQQKIEDGSFITEIQQKHPEWVGFKPPENGGGMHVSGNAAIALDQTPKQLQEALRRLYQQAVPDAARG